MKSSQVAYEQQLCICVANVLSCTAAPPHPIAKTATLTAAPQDNQEKPTNPLSKMRKVPHFISRTSLKRNLRQTHRGRHNIDDRKLDENIRVHVSLVVT